MELAKVSCVRILWRLKLRIYENIIKEDNMYSALERDGYLLSRRNRYINVRKDGKNDLSLLLRPFTSDIKVFEQIFVNNEFDDLIRSIGADTQLLTIIDAGANIGLSSVKFNSIFPEATIIPIEPNSENFATLLDNLNENCIKSTPIKAGVWNKSVRLYFNKPFGSGHEWGISVTEKPNGGEYVASISINDVVRNNKIKQIDLLKIDIEGSEKQLFAKDDSTLNFLHITKFIAIEIHQELGVTGHILSILKKRGFVLSRSGEYVIGRNKQLTDKSFCFS